jgi:hypothetical protein
MMRSVIKQGAEKDYDAQIQKMIQNVMLDVFGEKSLNKIRQILKDNYSLEWQDIPEKSEAFSSALKEILGKGALIIEDLIVENLYNSYGKELLWRKDFSFSDYILNLSMDCRPIYCT